MESKQQNLDAGSLSQQVIAAAMRVAGQMPFGYSERVYVQALARELQEAGLQVAVQQPLKVAYDQLDIGMTFGDLVVGGALVVEVTVSEPAVENRYQQLCLDYLTASGHELCLQLHFSSFGLRVSQITRVVTEV